MVIVGPVVVHRLGYANGDVARLDVGHRAVAALAFLAEVEVARSVVGIVLELLVHHHLVGGGGACVPLVHLAVEAILTVVDVSGQRTVARPGCGERVVGPLIDIVAAAAAVDVADVKVVGCVGGAYLYRAVPLHPAGDVVAAIDGVDSVGVVHRDVGVAAYNHVGILVAVVDAHVGHTPAAAEVAVDDRRVLRLAVRPLRNHAGKADRETVCL